MAHPRLLFQTIGETTLVEPYCGQRSYCVKSRSRNGACIAIRTKMHELFFIIFFNCAYNTQMFNGDDAFEQQKNKRNKRM